MRARWSFCIVLVALAALGAGVVTTASGEDPPRFAVLDRARTNLDVLPEAFVVSPAREEAGVDPEKARFLGAYRGMGFFLAPGVDDTKCLITSTAASLCTSLDGWRSGVALVIYADDVRIAALGLPDGYKKVSNDALGELPVKDNVAFVDVPAEGVEKSDVSATTISGKSRALSDFFVPPAPPTGP